MLARPRSRRMLAGNFQYRLLLGNFLYLASVVLLFFIVLVGPVVRVLADATVTLGERESAAQQLLALHERVWFALPVMIALCILHSALLTNRVAGPLHRFKRVLADLANGERIGRATLRRHDYLREEAEVLTELMRGVNERAEAIEERYRQASATLPSLVQAIGRNATEETAVLAGKLGTQMDALGREIRRFTAPPDAAWRTAAESLPSPAGSTAGTA